MDRGRDRLLLWILVAHLPLAALMAFIYYTSSLAHDLSEMAIIPVLGGLAYWRLAGHAPTAASRAPC